MQDLQPPVMMATLSVLVVILTSEGVLNWIWDTFIYAAWAQVDYGFDFCVFESLWTYGSKLVFFEDFPHADFPCKSRRGHLNSSLFSDNIPVLYLWQRVVSVSRGVMNSSVAL